MSMGFALLRKSWRDLNQRKVRSIFTILTIMLGVAALGMFAVMPLLDQAMQDEIRSSNMHDVILRFNDTVIGKDDLEAINGLDNVDNSEALCIFFTKILIGDRRNAAWIVGVSDFGEMSVDKVTLEEGEIPELGSGDLLSERANIDTSLLSDVDEIRMYDSFGIVNTFNVTGIAHNPHFSGMPFAQVAVFYSDVETVRTLANASGYNMLALDLEDCNDGTAKDAIAGVNGCLSERTSFDGYSQMPQVRKEGEWPLKELFESVGSLFNVIAYIVLFCSLFLISNTMHTIITEQRKEIAQLKAIGATRSQVMTSYLTTSLIMGLIGSLMGVILGVLIAFGMATIFGTMIGIRVGFGVNVPTIAISFIVGCSITVLASIPAIVMALRVPVREGLEGCGISSNFGSSLFDRIMIRIRSGSIPMIAQIGVRNASRRKGRSASTMFQVALAVGMLLGVITSCVALSQEIDREFSCVGYDIQTSGQEDGAKPLTEDMKAMVEGIPGVESAEPFLSTIVRLDGHDTIALAYPHDTQALDTEQALRSGRWFSRSEDGNAELVVILNNRVARSLGVSVGDKVPIQTRAGTMYFEVVGIGIQITVEAYMPLGTVREVLGYGGIVSGFIVFTENKDHAEIDRVSTVIEDTLIGKGYLVNNQVYYVASEQGARGAESTETMLIASGALIVFVTMIGLMSMLTMNIIERTREIGILRCLGSSSASIASVFGIEGIVIAIGGWVLGLPVGYLVQIILTSSIVSSSGMDVGYVFPISFVFVSLFVTLAMTVLIIQFPLWRAGRFKPGEALRYQ
jgi:putative ABC transport system permease protein